MATVVTASELVYSLPSGRAVLQDIGFDIDTGSFLAVLGENGAGKTTLLDLLMGFRRRSGGKLAVLGQDPDQDPWETRQRVAYLSEKVDIPGDWDAREFLEFHRYFYPSYDAALEKRFAELFRVDDNERVGNLSAGEIRRLQIVAALATRPELLIADEITAVLDILGRRKFLSALKEQQVQSGLTVILATNIPEGLEKYADGVLLIHRGRELALTRTQDLLGNDSDLAEAVAKRLERL